MCWYHQAHPTVLKQFSSRFFSLSFRFSSLVVQGPNGFCPELQTLQSDDQRQEFHKISFHIFHQEIIRVNTIATTLYMLPFLSNNSHHHLQQKMQRVREIQEQTRLHSNYTNMCACLDTSSSCPLYFGPI